MQARYGISDQRSPLGASSLVAAPRASSNAASTPGVLHRAGSGARVAPQQPCGGKGVGVAQIDQKRSSAPPVSANDGSNAVIAFLKDIGLQMYAAPLLQSGFDDLETLLAIEDADLKDLGILPYHAVRLRKKFREMQQQSHAETEPDNSHPVAVFLAEVGIPQYTKALLNSGFDEMETLVLIDDQDMKDLGLLRGHSAKLKKRLREYEIEFAPKQEFLNETVFARAQPPQQRPPHTSRMPAAMGQQPISQHGQSIVQQSWEQVKAIGVDVVAERLYKKSFELLPECMPLFPPEVRLKYRDWSADETLDEEDHVWNSAALRRLWGKVINALGCTVAGLHDMGKLVPMMTKLGNRHINYGLQERYWPVVGKALDLTLQELLGASYTPEVQRAWTMVYGFTSSIMIEGLRQAVAARNQGLSLSLAHTVYKTAASPDDSSPEANDSTSERSAVTSLCRQELAPASQAVPIAGAASVAKA